MIPTRSHLALPWVMGYDNSPIKTIAEKKKILKRAAKEHWLLFLEHDPDCDAVTVKQSGEKIVEDSVFRFE